MRSLIAVVLALAVIFVFVPATTAQAPTPATGVQNIKSVAWSEFWRGIEFTRQPGGQWEFVHEGRQLHDYTAVEVPAGTLRVRELYVTQMNKDHIAYSVILDPSVSLRFKGDTSGENRDASILATYICKWANDLMCRQGLEALLRDGLEMQSLGVVNKGYEGGGLPRQPVFSFLLNSSSGRFNH